MLPKERYRTRAFDAFSGAFDLGVDLGRDFTRAARSTQLPLGRHLSGSTSPFDRRPRYVHKKADRINQSIVLEPDLWKI